MRKKLLFFWCLLSLLSFIFYLRQFVVLNYVDIEDFVLAWAIFSAPLIIHLIYFRIFGED